MKEGFWRKTLSVCLALLMVAALIPAQLIISAGAASNTAYIYRWWDSDSNQIKSETRYADANWLQDYDENLEDLNSGWYYSSGYKIFKKRVTIHGTVNIIICEAGGSYVEFADGIHLTPGNTLNIYGQSGESQDLKAVANTYNQAAIGGNDGESGGTVNIYSGKIEADSYTHGDDAAGIGGGLNGDGGTVTIYGGTVVAKGANSSYDGGAGIGGGDSGDGGTVTIYGGTVTATGGHDGAGIGGGDDGSGGTIEMWGGDVTANGNCAAGIGGGEYGVGESFTIYGGKVTATGGTHGAGIGGGDDKTGGIVKIYGGTVIAQGGSDGAGIGGGEGGSGGSISIWDGNVTATGGSDHEDGGAGIGSGDYEEKDVSGGTINIYGGTVNATGGPEGAGIGGGDGGKGGNINISGGTVIAKAGDVGYDGGAGIGGGNEASGGAITITGGDVTATGYGNGAGIGGGDGGNGGAITITEAKVTANGGDLASGIGGGEMGAGGTITINSGTVKATGGNKGAGIGGGQNASGGTIRIKGGDVTANGGKEGSGIGSGDNNGAAVAPDGGDIEISGGKVNATGGSDYVVFSGYYTNDGGAGIGGGDAGNGGKIKITGGEVIAHSGYQAAGIGGGDAGNSGNIEITGGTVKAYAETAGYSSNMKGGGAGIGDGNDNGTDTERSIKISGGNIIANADDSGSTYGTDTGAGIGGSNSGASDNLSIIITGCEKIDARGGSASAGIGGSDESGIGPISITGTVDIYAQGGSHAAGIGGGDKVDAKSITINVTGKVIAKATGDFGAGIGGGFKGKSGKITISSGTIEAYGASSAAGIGSGCGCTEDEDSVDVTINGGNIKAEGGGIVNGTHVSYQVGASIGAGGCTYNRSNQQNTDIKDKSYFAGSINLNGGTITAINSIGTTDDAALDGDPGIVNFNGATVRMETTNNHPSVRATEINILENSLLHKVSYKNSDSNQFTSVAKADRIPTLKENAKTVVLVSQCEHEGLTYSDDPIHGSHLMICPHCNYGGYENHSYGGPEWIWAEDFLSATATFTCEKCNRTETVNATVVKTIDEGNTGMATYTATVGFYGNSYTDTKNGYADYLGARVVGHSISLDGDIGVNFYMELSDSVANSDTAYMHFTIPKNGEPDTKDIKVSKARKVNSGDKTYYVFKCQVAAKEMTSEIKAQIIDGDNQGTEFTYSVKEYADYLLSHTDEREDFAKAAPLVKALLNYGAYTQIFFDKNPGKLANADLTEEEKALDEVTIEIDEPVIDLPEGTTFEGATLSLKSETTLSLYFESEKDLTFACEGKTVETVTGGKNQIARIRGINAKELKKPFTLTVKEGDEVLGTITYSPMAYCCNALSDDTQSEALQNVCKALYIYAQAADSYFPD